MKKNDREQLQEVITAIGLYYIVPMFYYLFLCKIHNNSSLGEIMKLPAFIGVVPFFNICYSVLVTLFDFGYILVWPILKWFEN